MRVRRWTGARNVVGIYLVDRLFVTSSSQLAFLRYNKRAKRDGGVKFGEYNQLILQIINAFFYEPCCACLL